MFRISWLMILMFILLCSCTLNTTQNVKESSQTGIVSNNTPCPTDVQATVTKVKKPCKPYIEVIGKGAPPNDESLSEVQRYLLAERAAVVDGYRQLAEKLEGFIIEALTTSGNYVINMDRVRLQTSAMIKGAQIVEISHEDNGVAIAKIKIRIPTNSEIVTQYRNINF